MKIKNRNVPLTINIVAIFLLITFAFAASLTWFNFQRNTEAALVSAGQLMSEISSKTFERLQLVYNPVITLASQAEQMPLISHKPSQLPHPISGFLFSAMDRAPQLYSTFMGWEDGEFYQLINYSEQLQKAKPVQGAPKDARYAIRHIFQSKRNGWIESWRFLNEDRILIDHKIGPSSGYDPRKRPWYKLAKKREDVVKTDLYIFNSLQAGGITMARRFDGQVPGVFGVDLTLSSLSTFLAEQEKDSQAQLLVFSSSGRLNAYPDPTQVVKTFHTPQGIKLEPASISDLNDPVISWLGDKVGEDKPQETASYFYEVNNKEMVAQVTPVPAPYGNGEYIAAIMSVDSLVEPLLKIRQTSLIFTLIALGIAAPLIIFFSWRISRPLKVLAEETQAIQNFQLDGDLEVTSYVDEVHKLASSIKTMKHALRTFGMYVPKALVRRMVSSGITPTRGGKRRPVTLLFTDVADFTTLADGTDPEHLMIQLSDYFEGMSNKIHETGGTIDKYIGDAVMAFWNAPDADPDHAKHACLAALRCQQVSEQMYRDAETSGKLKFHTRLGLHSGEVVVGNVGSSDRMDYTAIGSAVNMASRLEGLNKNYGTSILVSAITASDAGNSFCFRPLDLALPKGALTPITVMELVGLCPGSDIDPSLEIPDEKALFLKDWDIAWQHYMARRWEKARDAFNALSQRDPQDKAARVLTERCQQYYECPPPADWDGATHFTTK